MEIWIKSIPLKELVERYGCESAGDYWRPTPNLLNVRAADTGNEDFNFLISLHELLEEILCTKRGIKETDIQAFDQMFDREQKEGLHPEDAEPGNDPRAPYYREHMFATAMETLMCNEMGLKLCDYDEAVNALF